MGIRTRIIPVGLGLITEQNMSIYLDLMNHLGLISNDNSTHA
jgi:hypothetical protein